MKQYRFRIFSQRFDTLRAEYGPSNTEFANYLGISRQTVGFYLNGDRLPDALVLAGIAQKCGCSVDWLLGLSSERAIDLDTRRICELTGFTEATASTFLKARQQNSKGLVWFCRLLDQSLKYLLPHFANFEQAVEDLREVGESEPDDIIAVGAADQDVRLAYFELSEAVSNAVAAASEISELRAYSQRLVNNIHFTEGE